MSLRAIAWQSRIMQGGHALATRLPRRYAPRNDIIGMTTLLSILISSILKLKNHLYSS